MKGCDKGGRVVKVGDESGDIGGGWRVGGSRTDDGREVELGGFEEGGDDRRTHVSSWLFPSGQGGRYGVDNLFTPTMAMFFNCISQ